MYVHVPSATCLYVGCFITTVASALWLWKRTAGWDALAEAGAEVGLVFAAITLITGSLWGRPTWGTYWTWDARLTSTAVLTAPARRLPGAAAPRPRPRRPLDAGGRPRPAARAQRDRREPLGRVVALAAPGVDARQARPHDRGRHAGRADGRLPGHRAGLHLADDPPLPGGVARAAGRPGRPRRRPGRPPGRGRRRRLRRRRSAGDSPAPPAPPTSPAGDTPDVPREVPSR